MMLIQTPCPLPLPREAHHISSKLSASMNFKTAVSHPYLSAIRGQDNVRIPLGSLGNNLNIISGPVHHEPESIWVNTRDSSSRNMELGYENFIKVSSAILDHVKYFPNNNSATHLPETTFAPNMSISTNQYGLSICVMAKTVTIPFKGERRLFTQMVQGFQKAIDALKLLIIRSKQLTELRSYVKSDDFKSCSCKFSAEHLAAFHYGRGEEKEKELLPLEFVDADNLMDPSV